MREQAIAHIKGAIDALLLEAYAGQSLAEAVRIDNVTISMDLKRIDSAIGPKGESIFARIADRIDDAYIELLAARKALEESE